jgi:hypothetical protein
LEIAILFYRVSVYTVTNICITIESVSKRTRIVQCAENEYWVEVQHLLQCGA